MDNRLIVSTSPHLKTARTTKKIMLDVIIALLPTTVASWIFFGVEALVLELCAVLSAVAFEFIYYFIANGGFAKKCQNALAVCKKWYKQFDYTSIITGMILALGLPPTTKFYELIIGAAFAIIIVKMLFGGTGKNLVSPSTAARVFMFISFSITTYTACKIYPISLDSSLLTTGATYLSGSLLQAEPVAKMQFIDLFIGTGLNGCIGETCKLAILIGYAYLVIRKVIKWWQPALYIGATFALSLALNGFKFATAFDLTLSGGLIFGAVFMATDYVTSPKNSLGQIVYYIFLGVMTAILRHLTKLEVVSFVILLGNLIVPLIDTYIIQRPFGYTREKAVKEAN